MDHADFLNIRERVDRRDAMIDSDVAAERRNFHVRVARGSAVVHARSAYETSSMMKSTKDDEGRF